MLLYALSLQKASPASDRTQGAKPLAGDSLVVACDRQDILGFVLITSVALFPQALTLGLSTCVNHGLALIRARQPQLLVCIEPLVEEDTLALISQAKRLPAAPKILLVGDSSDSRFSRKVVETCCDGILGTSLVDAGTIFQALRIVLGGGTYRDPAVTTAPQNGNGPNGPQRDCKFTVRERQVLQLIVRGYSNQEISQQLHFGSSTVKTHVSRLLDKLDARDRTQAAVRAIVLGLVPWPASDMGVAIDEAGQVNRGLL